MSLSEETKAFIYIRNGEIEKALEVIDQIIREDEDNFWAWYLGSVAFGIIGKLSSMQHYLDRAERLQPESVYVIYMKAYMFLLDNDLEKSLWEWTKLTDLEEGWLAKELLEKARKNEIQGRDSKKHKIYEYIILPEFFNDLEKSIITESHKNIKTKEIQKNEKSKRQKSILLKKSNIINFIIQNKWKISILILVILLIVVVSLQYHWISQLYHHEKKESFNSNHLELDEYAHIYRKNTSKVQYKSRKALINDFNDAKKFLKNGKINQSRYLIQKIIYSNADFKTVEKAKLFLKFIPLPHYRDFDDNIPFKNILKETDLYLGTIILHEAEIIEYKEEEKGSLFKLIIHCKDAPESYIAHAFYSKNNFSNIAELKDFKKIFKGKKIVFYGKFKGIVGNQRIPYIEIYQLWI